MAILDPSDPLGARFGAAVADAIAAFLDGQATVLARISDELDPLVALARDFTTGGKRVRPACCAWGYVAAAGIPADPGCLIRAAASLDLLHVSALIHDDVMDSSDTRRGQPSAHRQFAGTLQRSIANGGYRGDSEAFGRAGAILLGDLLLVWSDELYRRSGLEPEALERGRSILEAVRTEVTAGQFLDVVAQSIDPLALGRRPEELMARVRQVVEYKTARYTMIRPLQLGAALAGGSEELREGLAAIGSALGRAFQFRDDILGVFGDPALTGKPAGDDLREGKLTVLVAHTIAGADPAGAAELGAILGDPRLGPDQISRARSIIVDSGALAAAEAEISSALVEARSALAQTPMTAQAAQGLDRLAEQVSSRRW